MAINAHFSEEARDGHLDTRSSLNELLENYEPLQPAVATLTEYESWDAATQAEFNIQRLDRIAAGIVLETSQIEDLKKELLRASFFAGRPIGRTGVILSGPAAAGKTTAAFHGMVEAFGRHVARYPDWKELGHSPVVYVEVPSGSTGKAIMGRFLNFLELPQQLIDRMTLEQRTQVARAQLTRGCTSLIVIDEMRNLAHLTSGHFESAQAIKSLLNAVKAVPLYVGVDLDKLLVNSELGAQFAGRSTCVRLDHFEIDTSRGLLEWRGAIHGFEKQLALLNHAPTTLLPLADYLWSRTYGSLGALSRLLTTAAVDLIAAGEPALETITIERLESIKLDLTTERARDRGITASKRKSGHAH